jgi:hypothetical protein
MPWKRRTRQQEGRVTEKSILKERGALIHPNSGAGSIKEDGHDEDNLYEVKDTASKSFTLKMAELFRSYVRACRQGKTAVWIIYFSKYDIVAEVKVSRRNS